MTCNDNNNDKEIIDGDKAAEWEDVKVQGQLLEDVAPPSTLLAVEAARAATLLEETDALPCWADLEIDDEMLLANQRQRRAEPLSG
jgi:hypothetical protein